jgi:hypothetical protein
MPNKLVNLVLYILIMNHLALHPATFELEYLILYKGII